MIVTRTALALAIAATLAVAGCGSDEGEGTDVENAAIPVGSESPVETAPATDPPVVEVPAEWLPIIPTPEIDGMRITGAVVRGGGDSARYDLRYDGGPLDAQVIYDDYEALVLTAGWATFDDADPLAGEYRLDGRTMTIVSSADAERSRLTVEVGPT